MRLFRITLAVTVLGSSLVGIGPAPAVASQTPLKVLGQDAGVLVGSAVRGSLLDPGSDEREYQDWVGEQLSAVTTENELKWDQVQPAQGVFDYAAADRVVGFAEEHGQAVRGHTLAWGSALPAWVTSLPQASVGPALERHIKTLVGHYRGRVGIWDVVNEPLNDDGTLRTVVARRGFWGNRLGHSYIADSFRWAHAADPSAKLYLNEFTIESNNAKAQALYTLVKDLLADDVPIHGIGFQTHKYDSTRLSGLADVMRRFADLGLDVAITELDVRIHLPADADALARQADVYGWATSACLAVPRCRSVTTWGFTDAHSWIENAFPGWGAATLLTDDYQPKPAYTKLREALSAGRPAAVNQHAWRLDDWPGSIASDVSTWESGYPADVAGGALGGEGRTPYVKSFTGNGSTTGAQTSGNPLNTSVSYTVAAWVRPANLDASRVILSQDGSTRSAFVLGHTTGKWYFSMPPGDPNVNQVIESVAAPAAGQWTHVAAVWNNGPGHATLYVNGVLDATGPLWTSSSSTGAFHIGEAMAGTPFRGGIADVRAFQRVLSDAELATVATPLVASWSFDGHTGDTSWFQRDAAARADLCAPPPLNACHDRPLNWTEDHLGNGNKAVNLTGVEVIDTRGGLPMFTNRSYSISIWVKLADLSRHQVVLAASGTNISPFYLEFVPGAPPTANRWVFRMPATDSAAATMQLTRSTNPAQAGVWTHLVVVWNNGFGQAKLYVNNVLAGTGPRPSQSFAAAETAALHIGGASLGRVTGAIDDLQIFQRVLTDAEIARLYLS